MKLVLFRHGIAIDREDPCAPPEEERFLTREGRKKTRAAARGLARLLDDDVPLLWSSPYLRALETARLLAAALKIDDEAIHVSDTLLPDEEPSRLVRALGKVGDAPLVVCVGHRPHLDRALAHLVVGVPVGGLRLKKAGACALEVSVRRRGSAALSWVATPGMLRDLGRVTRGK